MKHEDQIEFYHCPLCGIPTGNYVDENEKHDCPVEKEMRQEDEQKSMTNTDKLNIVHFGGESKEVIEAEDRWHDEQMTNTEKRLELFDEKFPEIHGTNTIGTGEMRGYIKEFLTESIQQAVEEERERVDNKIEEYFDGLMVVSLPQATKDSLLDSFREINNK